MADVVDKATRSRMMSGIRGKNTGPEILVRKAMHAEGLRFRIHKKNLPGNPDLVFPKYRAVVFVHGCFWHGHNCRLFKLPATRTEFWIDKIQRNIKRDVGAIECLIKSGWRVAIVWECSIKGNKQPPQDTLHPLTIWIKSSNHMRFVLDEHEGKTSTIF
ncbi:MAG: DNA mismatch endonuclease Vsr [Azonexus sp.]|nr:DNA mismatch endonuclease Vsr [Azonexus sp.]